MQHWYHIFPKNTGVSLYIWIIFCVLPFYFIFRSTSFLEVGFGIAVTLLFFAAYWVSFTSKKGSLSYVAVSVEMVINIAMTFMFGYVYFALFIAFFIGNIRRKAAFISLYVVHLVTTILTITVGFLFSYSLLLGQIPFLAMTVLGVILIPINRYNRLKQEELEGKLKDANRRIDQLAIVEERHRIARDLHDTLGQKLSMIGLKSELAGKLIGKDKKNAKREIEDIQAVSRQALKEVREMVSNMRAVRLKDEIEHTQQLLKVANIKGHVDIKCEVDSIPMFIENVLSMCLREAITNVVKHSDATYCKVVMKETADSFLIEVQDNGKGSTGEKSSGHGLKGMKERLDFVDGSLTILTTNKGFHLIVTVPKVIKQIEEGEA
ncbi:sensor histidine kinase [Gracilibacillus sp. YIM 98692]|uniref:sensor histidine kinase n=1 Tax=Gracilibacillus sp. YIM 98692 TaxID=2663532 RepID=UPI0013D742D3|nr:sensor histidine kinase [Gracilibacillus sp. YIM 98692]